jgi:TonB family protein
MRQFEKRTTHARRERFNQVFLLIPQKWLRRSLLLHGAIVALAVLSGMIPASPFAKPPPAEEPTVQVDLVGPEDPEVERLLANSAADPVGSNVPQQPSEAQSGANASQSLAALPPSSESVEASDDEQEPDTDLAEVPAKPSRAPTPAPTLAQTTPRPTPAPKKKTDRQLPKATLTDSPKPAAAALAPAPAQQNTKEWQREARRQALFSSLHVHMEGAGRQPLAGQQIADGASVRGIVDDERGRWVRDVIRAIQKYIHPKKFREPPSERDSENIFHIAFFADGTVKSVSFLERSKVPGFDEETERAIELAQPLPPPPNAKLLEDGLDIRGSITVEADR